MNPDQDQRDRNLTWLVVIGLLAAAVAVSGLVAEIYRSLS